MRYILLVLVFIGLLASCSEDKNTPEKNKDLSYVSEDISFTEDSIKLDVEMHYPQIKFMNDTIKQSKINSFITDSVYADLKDFKKLLVDPENTELKTKKLRNEFFVEDSIFIFNKRLFSFYTKNTYYNAGAAHPNSSFTTFNIDIEQKKLIKLHEIFRMDADYMNLLAQEATDILMKDTTSNKNLFTESIEPKMDYFQNFLLTDNGILLIFEPYSIAPYSEGTQYVLVPYINLVNDLDINYLMDLGISIDVA